VVIAGLGQLLHTYSAAAFGDGAVSKQAWSGKVGRKPMHRLAACSVHFPEVSRLEWLWIAAVPHLQVVWKPDGVDGGEWGVTCGHRLLLVVSAGQLDRSACNWNWGRPLGWPAPSSSSGMGWLPKARIRDNECPPGTPPLFRGPRPSPATARGKHLERLRVSHCPALRARQSKPGCCVVQTPAQAGTVTLTRLSSVLGRTGSGRVCLLASQTIE